MKYSEFLQIKPGIPLVRILITSKITSDIKLLNHITNRILASRLMCVSLTRFQCKCALVIAPGKSASSSSISYISSQFLPTTYYNTKIIIIIKMIKIIIIIIHLNCEK
jgi:hypothetical protein